MKSNGFNVEIFTHPETGFCHGGNADNCGTWMDKMGSVPGLNQGVPATPRDGAPIELVALQYSVLTFFADLKEQGHYTLADGYREWAEKIKTQFEARFYVNEEPTEDNEHVEK